DLGRETPDYHKMTSGLTLSEGSPRSPAVPTRSIRSEGASRWGRGGDACGRAGGTVSHERSDPDPLGDQARRPLRGRAAPAAGLRRVAPAGGAAAGPRGARPDTPGDRLGPRSLPAPRRPE